MTASATERLRQMDSALVLTDAGFAVFKELGSRGTSYSHDVVRAFQKAWNAHFPIAFPASTPARVNFAQYFVPLAVDGNYGPGTAGALGMLLSGSVVRTGIPAMAGAFQTWWRANSGSVSNYLNETRLQLTAALRGDVAPSSVASVEAQVQTAAQQNVPPLEGSSTRASGAVTNAQSMGEDLQNAARQDLPLATNRNPETASPFQITGRTAQGMSTSTKVILAGTALVLAGGALWFFAFRKKRKGRR